MKIVPMRFPTRIATTYKGLMEDRRRQRSGDDGQNVQIRSEPEGKQLARLAVPLIEWDLVNRMSLDARLVIDRLQPGSHAGHVSARIRGDLL
jgi:hypothetical protein